MKRLISIILAMLMFLSNSYVTLANENTVFYAYTTDTNEFDEYASNKLLGFLYGHYGYIDDSLILGKGISIINNNDFPKVVYPIWKNNIIIATFIVANINGVYSGTFSNKTYLLNELLEISNVNNPIILIANENGFYAVDKEYIYDMNCDTLNGVVSNQFQEIYSSQFNLIDSSEEVYFNKTGNLITRANPNSAFMNGWYTYRYDNDHSIMNHCYTFCLYNIFRNLGITDYTFNDIKTGILYGSGLANMAKIKEWLDSENISYLSNSSYLSYSNVYNILCTNDNYLMIGLTNQIENDTTQRHFMALYGCAYLTGITTYSVWDPESHELVPSSGGLLTLDGDTRYILNADAVTLRWDAGYIGNFSE